MEETRTRVVHMQRKTLDAIDIEILRLLIENSNQTYVQLSKKLAVHKDTVRKRIKSLLDQKVIERFTISINQDRLAELYPTLWRVVFTVAVLTDIDSFIKELTSHGNIIEVDEATPAAVYNVIVHAEFKDMNEFHEFTNWLRSKQNVDSSRLNVIPVYKQHKRRQRVVTVIKPKKAETNH